MPVTPTYPGVYIEEIPSGVRTITGVATSITAFIGYTVRGPVDEGVRCQSFADFERNFGGLAVDSPLSYAVSQFFQNGGSEAVIVRVALNARAAAISVANLTGGGAVVLEFTATSEGTWGNNLRLEVDYDTSNPTSLFNIRVVQLIERDGRLVTGQTEEFRNLSMNSFSSTYVVNMVNAGSGLVRVRRVVNAAAFVTQGTSNGGAIVPGDLDLLYQGPNSPHQLAFSLDGGPVMPFSLTGLAPLTVFAPGQNQFTDRLTEIAARIQAAIVARTRNGSVTVVSTGTAINATANTPNVDMERSSIRFFDAASASATRILRLGAENGGTEAEGAAALRPAQNGTLSAALPAVFPAGLPNDGEIQIDVMRGTINTPLNAAPIVVRLWGAGTGPPPVAVPTSYNDLLAALRRAFAAPPDPLLTGATVQIINNRVRVLPGSTAANAVAGADPDVWFRIANAGVAAPFGLELGVADENLSRYAPGIGAATFAQSGAVPGNNGTLPQPAQFTGVELDKTGIFALEDVDLFNILCIPEAADMAAGDMQTIYTAALTYCVRRRAFLIVDVPGTVDTLTEAVTWGGATLGPLRGSNMARNAAAYFPRILQGDPLRNNVTRAFPASGAIAGLYARTDAERGVWKAPAGTTAGIVGATGVNVLLNDRENGVLNPIGINVIRTLNLGGVATTVSWGARTLRGADAMTDEYKYIPVRRLALYLEESLYRGTQWVVFEPNDEPLWAQIRLNLGAFMHVLFRQGAFQGSSPRDAYFVKCDKETTTQTDIDLGRVNIVVGFAPLKPAEFVIIQIQQIARAAQP